MTDRPQGTDPSDVVLFDVSDGVATITLNRPERMNTMGDGLVERTLDALERCADDDAIRAVILTGTGRAFCAGGDLQGFAAADGGGAGRSDMALPDAIALLRGAMRTSELLHGMPKVTIAAINGACAGAGLSWACACDLRYAADTAVFNSAFMTAGLSGDFGGTWTLPRIVGPAKARELYLMAERFRADEALRVGLVSAVVPGDELMALAAERARRIVGFAPLTVRAIKQNLNESLTSTFTEQLDREADRHIRCGRTDDAREAAAAFIEKRPAVFHGR